MRYWHGPGNGKWWKNKDISRSCNFHFGVHDTKQIPRSRIRERQTKALELELPLRGLETNIVLPWSWDRYCIPKITGPHSKEYRTGVALRKSQDWYYTPEITGLGQHFRDLSTGTVVLGSRHRYCIPKISASVLYSQDLGIGTIFPRPRHWYCIPKISASSGMYSQEHGNSTLLPR